MHTTLPLSNINIDETIRRIDDLSPEAVSAGWLLLLGSRKTNPSLMERIGHLADSGFIHVLDCGTSYDHFLAIHAARNPTEAHLHIQACQAYTCRHVTYALKRMFDHPAPFVVLDFLRPFFHTNVDLNERIRLLEICLGHLDRLGEASGGLVQLQLPHVLCQAESDLLEIVAGQAKDTISVGTTPGMNTSKKGL